MVKQASLRDAIRFLPPLAVTNAEIDRALTIFGDAVAATKAG